MAVDPIMRVDSEFRDLIRAMIPSDERKRYKVKKKSKHIQKSRNEFYSFTDFTRYAAKKIKNGTWK